MKEDRALFRGFDMMEQKFSWHCCGVSIVTYDITYVIMISYFLTWS